MSFGCGKNNEKSSKYSWTKLNFLARAFCTRTACRAIRTIFPDKLKYDRLLAGIVITGSLTNGNFSSGNPGSSNFGKCFWQKVNHPLRSQTLCIPQCLPTPDFGGGTDLPEHVCTRLSKRCLRSPQLMLPPVWWGISLFDIPPKRDCLGNFVFARCASEVLNLSEYFNLLHTPLAGWC